MNIGTTRMLAAVLLLATAGTIAAEANVRMRRAFLQRYPHVARTRLDQCQTCHLAALPGLNPYGMALKAATGKLDLIEAADSDSDRVANLAEIKALTLPGDRADKPGARADTSRGAKGAPGMDTLGTAPADSAGKR
jgi:hypothetical protein